MSTLMPIPMSELPGAVQPRSGTLLRPAIPAAHGETDLRDLALDRIQQGLCVFDGQQRLLLANRRYAEMYALHSGDLRIGMTLREVVALRNRAGTGPEMTSATYSAWRDRIGEASTVTDTEVMLRNGSVYAIHHEPIADGGWVATHTDITKGRQSEQQIRHMAHHDALTNLPNRVLFFDRLQAAVARLRGQAALEDHRPALTDDEWLVAVLFLDLDHFKDVNDTLGHAAGDELLRQVAKRIGQALDEKDTLARLGGDEFAILLDGTATSASQVSELAGQIIESVAKPYSLEGQEAVIGISLGISVLRRSDSTEPSSMMRQADLALYESKSRRRGEHCLFQPGMDAALNRRKDMERDLRRALIEGSLYLHYQPLVRLSTRRIVGVEALVRWIHPQLGAIPPSEFIPLAEASGLIVALGTWVMEAACRDAAGWPDVTLAVNLSPEQVRQERLVDLVEATLRKTGLPPSRLELEITEGVLLRDTAGTVSKMNRLRGLGVGVALDDFGTGYSSLSYLRRFPFNKLKIDRSFVETMMVDDKTAAIVQTIAALGRSLDMQVTAEGIETEAQFDRIRETGCTEGQGYLIGRPCAAQAFEALLRRDREAAIVCEVD